MKCHPIFPLQCSLLWFEEQRRRANFSSEIIMKMMFLRSWKNSLLLALEELTKTAWTGQLMSPCRYVLYVWGEEGVKKRSLALLPTSISRWVMINAITKSTYLYTSCHAYISCHVAVPFFFKVVLSSLTKMLRQMGISTFYSTSLAYSCCAMK